MLIKDSHLQRIERSSPPIHYKLHDLKYKPGHGCFPLLVHGYGI